MFPESLRELTHILSTVMEKAATREKQEEQEQQNKNISIGRNNEKGDEKRTINHVSFN
jgi:hypothetical protein